MYQLVRKEIVQASAITQGPEFWMKASLAGLFLHVTPTSEEVVGFSADALEGAAIYQYVGDNNVVILGVLWNWSKKVILLIYTTRCNRLF
jgi:hypothetical protein